MASCADSVVDWHREGTKLSFKAYLLLWEARVHWFCFLPAGFPERPESECGCKWGGHSEPREAVWSGHQNVCRPCRLCRHRRTAGNISVSRTPGVWCRLGQQHSCWSWLALGHSQCFRQLITVSCSTITRSAVVESSHLFQLLSPTWHPWKLLFVGDIFSFSFAFASAHWEAGDGSEARGSR